MHTFLRKLLVDNWVRIHRIHKVVHHLPDTIWLLGRTPIKIKIRHYHPSSNLSLMLNRLLQERSYLLLERWLLLSLQQWILNKIWSHLLMSSLLNLHLLLLHRRLRNWRLKKRIDLHLFIKIQLHNQLLWSCVLAFLVSTLFLCFGLLGSFGGWCLLFFYFGFFRLG